MRRYKTVACILLILSVFGFVLAAPVAVQEVREACADALDGGENVIIGSGKRAVLSEEEQPLLQSWKQQQEATASSYWQSTPWREKVSTLAPNYASGTRPNPSVSSGESKPPLLSTSGRTELSWNPEDKPKLIQPGTSTEIQPPSSSRLAKSVSFASSKEVILPSGEISTEMLHPEEKPPQLYITGGTELSSKPEGEPKLIQPGTSTEIQPASSSKAESGSFAPSKVLPPSGDIYTGMPESDIKPLLLPPGPEEYPTKVGVQPTKPKLKNIFSKLIGKLKFRP